MAILSRTIVSSTSESAPLPAYRCTECGASNPTRILVDNSRSPIPSTRSEDGVDLYCEACARRGVGRDELALCPVCEAASFASEALIAHDDSRFRPVYPIEEIGADGCCGDHP